jgi:HJR/Mrr/RecB family endonuclease
MFGFVESGGPSRAVLHLPFVDPIGDYDEVLQGPGVTRYRLGRKNHRLDGAAVNHSDGFQKWYQAGHLHRADGPAAIAQHWRVTGEKYRHNPPIRPGTESPKGRFQWSHGWYVSAVLHRTDGPALRWQDGTDEWFEGGRRHRVGFPAVVGSDGLREWHQYRNSFDPPNYEANFYALQGDENYYRVHGPSVLRPGGYRYWGDGSLGGYDSQTPRSGPYIEYPDGSVDFVEGGTVRNRGSEHESTIALRRAGRSYVEKMFAPHPGLALSDAPFIPYLGVSHVFEEAWRTARLEDRRQYAQWSVAQWQISQGNLNHDDERQCDEWLERFEQTVNAEREEVRIWREDMRGYLPAALRRLEFLGEPPLWDSLQQTLDILGLPLTGAVSQLTPESRLLKAVVTAPPLDEAVPVVLSDFHIKNPSARASSRTARARHEMYINGIAECALAALATMVRCESAELVDTILLNIMVDDIDRTTGRTERYCVLSVQVERTDFAALNLHLVDPVECVKSLGAAVPRGRTELTPVRPILAFDKEDARIVAAIEVASRLDSRANLMELSPNDFEALIQNLFTKIGLDTHQTQASRDGGVDCIAYDSRPIFGGKIIIQAKRYKNTVGVAAVRDLWGTVMNEGASKGLLVTTSGYGKASYEFAKNKPLELLEGGHLLHLLKEHLGLSAVIVPPLAWVDPVMDGELVDETA